ncbi:AbrB/MazE/SpoVT family DNA-binding domain-containing protein [Lactobacillus sp.]|uniref:AbrB/MazE/SpoVT family DNA-binding domain-containing protein n=1 Tax=Lactobacillus sp. TaxID=1591 RepID=UPI0025FAED92|nr:AbrB/MazE/SpoVT family DNA-binding domain-containing protein [Lactobacillus sp.]MCO6536315.1 AbrB/MazE/SpoVT family DNA-binding domain-containing protein [Lactobacillus sp.]
MEKKLGNFFARKVGNSTALTIPSKADVKLGQRFELTQENNGTVIYKSIGSNPWFNGEYDDIDFKKEIEKVGNSDTMQIGKENMPW